MPIRNQNPKRTVSVFSKPSPKNQMFPNINPEPQGKKTPKVNLNSIFTNANLPEVRISKNFIKAKVPRDNS